ncbi:MAG: DUF481 domain-containing protein [Gemmatimonadales bacterium]|nr:MAG: DUF481 domain-containing protein [Gemmatimonadales bacterium]
MDSGDAGLLDRHHGGVLPVDFVRVPELARGPGGSSHRRDGAVTSPRRGGSGPWRALVSALVFAAGLTAGGDAAVAQSQDRDWKAEGELGGNFFFGNREQTQVSSRVLVERADSLFESASEFRFAYGEATDRDGIREVNRRNWAASASLDFRPTERYRPFVSGRMESAFERRIALRYNAGAGFRVSWDRDRRNRVDLSASILAERTYAREGGRGTEEDVGLARWSSNLRIRRAYLDNRFTLDSNNSYRPVFDSFGNYTLSTRNAFSYSLTEVVALRLTVITDFDSGAQERGAETNRDGQIQITLVARF